MINIECPVRNSALKFPEEIAVYESQKKISYLELDKKINSLVRKLSEKGVIPEMRIGIISENSFGYVIMMFALLRIGCTIVPVNFRFSHSEICRIIEGMKIEVIVSAVPGTMSCFPATRVIIFEDILAGIEASADVQNPETSIIKGKMVILTSGSTGKPKGVLLSAENNYYSALGSNMNISLSPGDKWYLILPIYHIGGLAILFRAFLAGAAVVFPAGRKKNIFKDIISYEITHVSMVNAQLIEFLSLLDQADHRLPGTLKAVLAGGGAIPESTIKKCLNLGVPVYKTYGLSEMCSQVTTTPAPVTADNMSTSGSLLKYRELAIGRRNKVLVKGETLFEGYISNGRFSPAETDEEGWFYTGDKGYLTSAGDLILTGREDNMFISGGENIFPEEIENVLMKIDTIIEAVVVPVDHIKFGKRPVAFIAFGEKGVSRENILSELRKNLPGFKIPDKFYLINELRPGLLKRRRGELIDLARSGKDLCEISD